MTTNVNKYIVSLDNLNLTKILSTWLWLTGENKNIIALTKAGDALLKDNNNNLYFLNVGIGTLELISNNYLDFITNKLSTALIEEILLPTLIDHLESNNIKLTQGQVYSYTTLPILGGAYNETNMYALNLYEHFNLTGNIHYQLKDISDDTKVNIVIE